MSLLKFVFRLLKYQIFMNGGPESFAIGQNSFSAAF